MLFNSYAFIFLFLPITIFGYFALGKINKIYSATFLAIASLIFYSYWNVNYTLLLLASISTNYLFGFSISKATLNKKKHAAKAILIISIILNLTLLAYYKYINFIFANFNSISDGNIYFSEIILPLGISFFTFTQIAFLVDTYKNESREYNFIYYLLFVTYFPHLIAGPILHHKEMIPQFAELDNHKINSLNIACGFTFFFIGLFKKTVLADNLAPYATPVFNSADLGNSLTFFEAWGGALAYSFQLYFDFSGYCDMAIGISWLFGIRLPINFNSPYKAKNIIDFWRRWHITLSRFLRDYLYFALGGNRSGKTRRYINLILTMLLGGLWHGAAWNFILWGLLHGFYLIANHSWRSVSINFKHSTTNNLFFTALSIGLTFVCVIVAWVFFRATTIKGSLNMLSSMFLFNGLVIPTRFNELFSDESKVILENFFITFGSSGELFQSPEQIYWILSAACICWFAPNAQQLLVNYKPGTDKLNLTTTTFFPLWKPTILWSIIVSIIATTSLAFMNRVSEFLYFQF